MTQSDHAPQGALRGFIARNRDDLWLEVIGGVVLAGVVSGVMFLVDASREDSRNAHDESLSNSLFVRQAVMNGADVLPFSSLYLEGAQLSGLDLAGADFEDADLRAAELKGADLTAAALDEADLADADLSDADLAGSTLTEATLSRVDLSGTDLTGADLTGAVLTDAWYDESAPPSVADEVLAALTAVDSAQADIDDD